MTDQPCAECGVEEDRHGSVDGCSGFRPMPAPERNFAVFILSHGRPDNVLTYRALRRHGYLGPVYILIDDEDPTADAYRARYGDQVIQFCKADVASRIDTADSQQERRTSVFARNASQEIAREMGYDYLLQLDDDYTLWHYRYVDDDGEIRSHSTRALDQMFAAMFDLLDDTGAAAVAMSQGGDHMGGVGVRKGYRRKVMNSMFLDTRRPLHWVGRMNEDVNTYVLNGSRGDLFLTVMGLQLEQVPTQQNAGGVTEAYLSAGTYVKSFYTLMMCPSAVRIVSMGRVNRRLHHQVRYRYAVPVILGPEHRKPRQESFGKV